MNTLKDVACAIADILYVEPDDIKADCDFKYDFFADELDMIEILSRVECQFDISISDKESQNIHTVQDLIDVVEAKQK